MECANVAFSVVPKVTEMPRVEIVFDFDIVTGFCTILVSVTAFSSVM